METTIMREQIKSWVMTAAQEIRHHLNQPIVTEEKSNRKDIVTAFDRQTEQYIREQIKKVFPNDGIIGEEGMGEQQHTLSGAVWFIDPIDGTTNFVYQRNNFAIMVARYVDGQPQIGVIYDVMRDEYVEGVHGEGIWINGERFEPRFEDLTINHSLIAINTNITITNRYQVHQLINEAMGLRCYGSAGLELLALLKGEISLYITPHLKPWDVAAGAVILGETTIKISQMDGQPLNLLGNNATVAGFPSAYAEFRQLYDENQH